MQPVEVYTNLMNSNCTRGMEIRKTLETEEEAIQFAKLFSVSLSFFDIFPRKKLKDLNCHYNLTTKRLNWTETKSDTKAGDKVICYKKGMFADKLTKDNVCKLFETFDSCMVVLVEKNNKMYDVIDLLDITVDKLKKILGSNNMYIVTLDNDGETFIVE